MSGDAWLLAGSGVSVEPDPLAHEFEARVIESATLAFRVAFSVLRQHQDAEDVAQEAFIKAHRHFRRLRDRERFRTWLVRTTWRLALNRQRSNRRRLSRELAQLELPRARTPWQELESLERLALVWAAIEALPDKLRLVVVLANIEELDLAEVAELLGVPQGTVKSRLFLARQRLKEHLQCMNTETTTR